MDLKGRHCQGASFALLSVTHCDSIVKLTLPASPFTASAADYDKGEIIGLTIAIIVDIEIGSDLSVKPQNQLSCTLNSVSV